MGLFDLTSTDLKKIAASKNVNKITRLSSKELREFLLSKGSSPSKKNKRVALEPREQLSFYFSYSVKRYHDGFKFILTGRHYSKNSVNGFSRREKIRYTKAIHEASEDFRLVNLGFFRRLKAFSSAEVSYTFYNPCSRDHDNNSETLKHFQDTFVSLGFIVDDNRKCLSHRKEVSEIIDPVYRAEAILLPS